MIKTESKITNTKYNVNNDLYKLVENSQYDFIKKL